MRVWWKRYLPPVVSVTRFASVRLLSRLLASTAGMPPSAATASPPNVSPGISPRSR
jgi:hypothetical protein